MIDILHTEELSRMDRRKMTKDKYKELSDKVNIALTTNKNCPVQDSNGSQHYCSVFPYKNAPHSPKIKCKFQGAHIIQSNELHRYHVCLYRENVKYEV